ncbi:MAG: DUF4256 domain-containing protein [Bacteroidota bacterium]
MALAEDTARSTGGTDAVEVSEAVSPEIKVAAIQVILSELPVEVSEVLRGRREEIMVLVQRLLDSAGIEGAFSAPKAGESNEVTVEQGQIGAPADKELSPEQAWLAQFKARFDALPQLHAGVEWADVEKSLLADQEAVRKLMKLDAAGFEMNVFRAKNDGEIQFRTAQTDVTKIAEKYRTIMYDKKAHTDFPGYSPNNYAVDIAASLGVEVADKELYEQFRVQNGWVWLITDAVTRKTGDAFYGSRGGVSSAGARDHRAVGSFCAALRVKKA